MIKLLLNHSKEKAYVSRDNKPYQEDDEVEYDSITYKKVDNELHIEFQKIYKEYYVEDKYESEKFKLDKFADSCIHSKIEDRMFFTSWFQDMPKVRYLKQGWNVLKERSRVKMVTSNYVIHEVMKN